MSDTSSSLETKAIHAGEPRPRIQGAVALPIFQTAMCEYDGGTDYHNLKYLRLNNSPNHLALHAKLAALEGGEDALVAASGMAAITTTLLALLKSGDHLLIQNPLYGGTFDFITKDLPDLGITFDFLETDAPESWADLLAPNTRAILVETMTNPTLQVIDHRRVVAFARDHGLFSLVDNTFASPINYRPPEQGYDLSLHSATKFLNGHSDLVAGAVIGKKELVERVRLKLNHLGGSLDPHACFLLHRGLKTLAVRMKHQNESTLKIARFLEAHPAVARVNYPGLEGHPYHTRAVSLFDGFSGVLSFEIKTGSAELFISRTRIPIHTFSLGGVETLIIQPAKTSHAGLTPRERARAGISDNLIRLSVGLEATGDIIADFSQAFATM